MSLLVVYPDKCTGCLQCEKVCSLKHEGECIPARSRVKVLRSSKMGKNGYFVSIPAVCQQCDTPMCKEACPVEAIYQDLTTGAYLVNESKCVGCKLCTIACPLGVIEVHPNKKIAYKCDFCDDDPQCAKVCLDGAITYSPRDKIGFERRRESLKNLANRLELIGGPVTVGGK